MSLGGLGRRVKGERGRNGCESGYGVGDGGKKVRRCFQ